MASRDHSEPPDGEPDRAGRDRAGRDGAGGDRATPADLAPDLAPAPDRGLPPLGAAPEPAGAQPASPSPSAADPNQEPSSSFVKLIARASAALDPRARQRSSPPPAAPPPPRRRRRRDTLPGVVVGRRGLRGSFHRIVNNVESKAAGTQRRRILYPIYALRIILQVLRQWARDRCPMQAASLAYQTVLSIVPVIAVILAALRATDSLDAQSSLVNFLASEFIPVSRDEIAAKLLEWSQNINFESLGLIGLITTVLLAFLIVNSLERAANFIWRAERKRSLAQKFVIFYATATLGPFLLGTGLYQAGKAGLTEGVTGPLLSIATSLGGLFLANYFLPACRVRLWPALAGALVSTILFETAKFGFNLYVTNFAFDKYSGIYGAVAVLPLWLLWIYYSWLTLLLGFEVAHAMQHLHLLERLDRRGAMSLENELLSRVNGVVAARVMVAIAEGFSRGDKVTSRRALESRFDLSDDVLSRIVDRLARADLILEVEGELSGYIPARPPHEISLANVLRVFRGDDIVTPSAAANRSRLDKVLVDIEADALQRTGQLYLDELY